MEIISNPNYKVYEKFILNIVEKKSVYIVIIIVEERYLKTQFVSIIIDFI